MKRKTKTGVKLLTQVIERMRNQEGKAVKKSIDADSHHSSLSSNSKLVIRPESGQVESKLAAVANTQGDEKDYIFPLLFVYRAYGYIILEEYDKSLRDFIKSSQIKKLNASQNYNMVLCQGLKNMQ